MYVYTEGRMDTYLTSAWTFWRLSFLFDVQHFLHDRSVSDNHEYSRFKIWAPSGMPQNKKLYFFLENGGDDSHYVSIINGD
jgi:hypothetical protein